MASPLINRKFSVKTLIALKSIWQQVQAWHALSIAFTTKGLNAHHNIKITQGEGQWQRYACPALQHILPCLSHFALQRSRMRLYVRDMTNMAIWRPIILPVRSLWRANSCRPTWKQNRKEILDPMPLLPLPWRLVSSANVLFGLVIPVFGSIRPWQEKECTMSGSPQNILG